MKLSDFSDVMKQGIKGTKIPLIGEIVCIVLSRPLNYGLFKTINSLTINKISYK